MNDETRKVLVDLYGDMALAGCHKYGEAIDQIRVEIEQGGYSLSHQHELGIILKNLKTFQLLTFAERLKNIIDSLGSPQHT